MRKIAGVLFDTEYVRGDADREDRRLRDRAELPPQIEAYESVNGA